MIAPVGFGPNRQTYNINADTAAGAIACAIDAQRLLMMTDVPGVLDKSGQDDPAAHLRRSPGAHRRRHDLRRHDPEARDLPDGGRRRRRSRGRRWTAACRMSMLLEIFTPQGVGTLVTRG